MRLTVKLFGPEAALVGRSEVEVELGPGQATCADLRQGLASAQPRLAAALGRCRLAVNHEFAGDEVELKPGDEVALIGLVSGG